MEIVLYYNAYNYSFINQLDYLPPYNSHLEA